MIGRVSEPIETRVTLLLQRVEDGAEGAQDELLAALYDELHRMAAAQVRKLPPGRTLQATALVHEAYLRILGGPAHDNGEHDGRPDWRSRRHFFFVAARAMHDILVEDARRKATSKRGGGWQRADLSRIELAFETPADDMLALADALAKLEAEDPERAQLVHLRFFAGLGESEAAEVLGVSLRTVQRRWRFVRAWLHRELGGDAPASGEGAADGEGDDGKA